MINEPIFITGLPRSGTSLVAGCISLCGAFGGDLIEGNRWNRKGFFENSELREPFIKDILADNGFCPVGVHRLPPRNYNPINDIATDVLSIIAHQGYNFDMPWFFKDAKLALVWPVWNRAFPNAKWIITTRRKKAILQSCLNTRFMQNQNLTVTQWEKWHEDYNDILLDLSMRVNAKFISTEVLASGNTDQLKLVLENFGLKYNNEVDSFIDKNLWHY